MEGPPSQGDLGVQGHSWPFLACQGRASGRWDSCLRPGRLLESKVLAWGKGTRPPVTQETGAIGPTGPGGGVRGLWFGCPAPNSHRLGSPQPSIPGGETGGQHQGRCSPAAASPQRLHLGLCAPEPQPVVKPTQNGLFARLSPTRPPASSHSSVISPTCPQAKGQRQRGKDAFPGLAPRPRGQGWVRDQKRLAHCTPPHLGKQAAWQEWESGGGWRPSSAWLAQHGTAPIQARRMMDSPGTGGQALGPEKGVVLTRAGASGEAYCSRATHPDPLLRLTPFRL